MARVTFLDLTAGELSVYTIDAGGSLPEEADIVRVPVSRSGGFAQEQLQGLPEEARTGRTYLSLPLEMLDFRIIEMPFSDSRKILELLPYELDGLILGGMENAVFDARVLGPSNKEEGKYRVLAAYVVKDLLRNLMAGLKASGIDPAAVISIELAAALNSTSGDDIADRLIAPGRLTSEERLAAAARETENPAIDLRRGEFAYTADADRTRKSLRLTAVLAAVLLLLFLADTTMIAVAVTKENRRIREEMRRVYSGLYPNEKKVIDETYQLKAHLKELKEKADTLTGISPLQYLLDLSVISGAGSALTEISLEKELVVLKGECGSLSDVQKIKGELERFLSNVNISDTRPSSQGKTLFTITAKGRRS